MRASKLPYKNFGYNIRRAEALARLDGYLKDILYNEGKRTIQPLFQIPNELMHALGFDEVLNRISERFEQAMKKELDKCKWKEKENYEKAAKNYVKQLRPRLQRFARMVEDLGLLKDQTLLEQALIAAVSAFEVYLRELTVSIIRLNPTAGKRFLGDVKAIDVSKLEVYRYDAKRAQGEAVANLIRLEAHSIRKFLNRLIGLHNNIYADTLTEQKVRRILETRHVMIHRAGFTDPKFKKITKSRSSVDEPITLTQRFVLDSIKTLRQVAERIENDVR